MTFLYAGSLSLAAAKMLGPTSAETFVAVVFFIVYGLLFNIIIWHHFIRYLCKQRKVQFDPITRAWVDHDDYVFDAMWQSIYDVLRDIGPDSKLHGLHPYFYRLAYYFLLLVKAVIMGLPEELVNGGTQVCPELTLFVA